MRAVGGLRVPAPRGGLASSWAQSPAAVVVIGALDTATLPPLQARLDTALRRRPACLQVDLSGCTSLDSSAVELLLTVRDDARRDGIVLVLARPSRPVRRLLTLLGLDEAFAVQ